MLQRQVRRALGAAGGGVRARRPSVVDRLVARSRSRSTLEQLLDDRRDRPRRRGHLLRHVDRRRAMMSRPCARIARAHGALTLVDGVSAIGGMPFAFDAWDVDVAVTASQKCLMSSPGVAFAAVSDRAWTAHATRAAAADTGTSRRSAQSISKPKPETPGTPPVHAMLQVAEALRMMHEEGLERVYARHGAMAACARERAASLGLSMQCPVESDVCVDRHRDRAARRHRAEAIRDAIEPRGIETAEALGPFERTGCASATWATSASRTSSGRSTPCGRRSRGNARPMKLHHKIFLALLARGSRSARSRGSPARKGSSAWSSRCEPLGTAFIRLITMVVVPLVVASLFVGVASLGDIRRLGRIGGKTLGYFLVTTIVAAGIGLLDRAASPASGMGATRDGCAASARRPTAATAVAIRRLRADARRIWCRRIRSRRRRKATCCRSSSPSASSAPPRRCDRGGRADGVVAVLRRHQRSVDGRHRMADAARAGRGPRAHRRHGGPLRRDAARRARVFASPSC